MQFIGGDLVEGSGPILEVLNPFTEEVVAKIKTASEQDVDKAVKAAKSAQEEWQNIGGKKRAEFLKAIAKEIGENKKQLSKIETDDCGKPIGESEWDMDDCVGCLEYYAGLAVDLEEKPETKIDVGSEDYECVIRQDPAGVAGLIIPFNYPLLMAMWKIGPALASGCTAVLKPSELTPMTAIELAKICQKVSLPAGVLNIVIGGGETGAAICSHHDVNVVAFTGSVGTGVKIAQMCAPQVKACGLELGGKSAAIVFADSDMNKAAEWVAFGCFWTNGQICSATSRLLVEESAFEAFSEKLKTIINGIKMGDPMEEDCRLGPLVSARQQAKAYQFITDGVMQGAKVLVGSAQKPTGKGYFVEPHVLLVNSENNVVWQEEIFAPVLSVMTFKTDKEAVDLANRSKYGLAAAVFTKDIAKFAAINNKLQVGIVWNNCSQPCFCQLPWGGRKLSGFGRDLGEFGLKKFLEPKQIVRYVSQEPLGWYDCSKL